jgi:putative component of toxin-antitoxin plasmid stabilization module
MSGANVPFLTQIAGFKLGNFFDVSPLGDGNSELRDLLTQKRYYRMRPEGEDQCH